MNAMIIRGPLGVGKSTVSKIVAGKMGAVYFSIDDLLQENGLDQAADGGGIPLDLLGKDVVVFTLKAPVELCIARDAGRERPYGEGAARAVHMFVSAFDYGVVIETGHQKVEETVAAIFTRNL